MTASEQYVTFFLDGLFLGVEVLKVQEIIKYQEMTRVPLAPGMIGGLINLRGQIVAAIDLRQRFGLHGPRNGQSPMNVVVFGEDGPVSLLVDEIGDVVALEDEARELPPPTLKRAPREMITAVYKLKDRLLMILDTERAVSLPGTPSNPRFNGTQHLLTTLK